MKQGKNNNQNMQQHDGFGKCKKMAPERDN